MTGRSRFGLFLGRFCGIKFYLDYSWFLIAAIVTYELAADLFPANLPGRSHTLYFIMGVVGALVFFLSILLHELGHSLVSQRCGIPVPRITLLFIGGIAEISASRTTPGRSSRSPPAARPPASRSLCSISEARSFRAGFNGAPRRSSSNGWRW